MALLGDLGLRGGQLVVGVTIVDLIIATVFSIPAAFVLSKLRPHKIWLFAWVAVFTGFLIIYGSMFIDLSRMVELWPGVMMGWINILLPIPLAVLLIGKALPPKVPYKALNTDACYAGTAQLRR